MAATVLQDPTGYEVSQASCAEGSFFTSKAAGQDEDFWDMDSAGEQTSWSWPASDKAASRVSTVLGCAVQGRAWSLLCVGQVVH